jgi:hypothetical protein
MVGGPRPDSMRHKFRSPSYQVQEGDTINIDVTSPGATLALGLMFFRSGNLKKSSFSFCKIRKMAVALLYHTVRP